MKPTEELIGHVVKPVDLVSYQKDAVISRRSVSAPTDPVGGIVAHSLACADVISYSACGL